MKRLKSTHKNPDLYTVILNLEKRLARAKNNANSTELKRLKKELSKCSKNWRITRSCLKMKELDRAKKLCQKLRNDENSILFGKGNLTKNIVKKAKTNLTINKTKNL